MSDDMVALDLNNPIFQRDLFGLEKSEQAALLGTLKKIRAMTWKQIYSDSGLNWETIHSKSGPGGNKLYSFRVSKSFRAVAYRDGAWLRILSLHTDHDSAYWH